MTDMYHQLSHHHLSRLCYLDDIYTYCITGKAAVCLVTTIINNGKVRTRLGIKYNVQVHVCSQDREKPTFRRSGWEYYKACDALDSWACAMQAEK